MIADSKPAEPIKPPTISPQFSTTNTSTNHLQNKFRKSKIQPPSLTIIDVNQLNLQNEQQFDKSKPERNEHTLPTKSNWQGDNNQPSNPSQELESQELESFKKPLCVLNLADSLDVTSNPMNMTKKSSLPLKRKTVEWVMRKSESIIRESLNTREKVKTPVVFKQDFNFDLINHDEIAQNSQNAQNCQNTQMSNYHKNLNSILLNRTGLGSAFSSIPWCYNSESAQPNKLPADNAIMPDQLYVRSVGHLKKDHRTGISRPGSTLEHDRDELNELKNMDKPVLHQAIKEAVGLGLMTVEESRMLLDVINAEKQGDCNQQYTSTSAASNPISDPGHCASQESDQENNNKKCALHNVGIVDPGVGFEPVEVEWKSENIVEINGSVNLCENVDSPVPQEFLPEEMVPDQLEPDQLETVESVRKSISENSEIDEKEGCVARPSTARVPEQQ